MVLKLYYDLVSQPSRALYIVLKLSKSKLPVPVEFCAVKLRNGEHLSEEFKEKFSKYQKVPFIHDGDFKLAESIGIVRYLSREYPTEDHWYPRESKAQAKADEYLEWQHLNVRLNCVTYFTTKWLTPMMTGKPASEQEVKSAEKHMVKNLKSFEELFLANGPFILGDCISYADIAAACEIEQPRIAGYDPREHFPKIKTWIQNVRKECNPVYDEAHAIVNKMVQMNDEKRQAKL